MPLYYDSVNACMFSGYAHFYFDVMAGRLSLSEVGVRGMRVGFDRSIWHKRMEWLILYDGAYNRTSGRRCE